MGIPFVRGCRGAARRERLGFSCVVDEGAGLIASTAELHGQGTDPAYRKLFLRAGQRAGGDNAANLKRMYWSEWDQVNRAQTGESLQGERRPWQSLVGLGLSGGGAGRGGAGLKVRYDTVAGDRRKELLGVSVGLFYEPSLPVDECDCAAGNQDVLSVVVPVSAFELLYVGPAVAIGGDAPLASGGFGDRLHWVLGVGADGAALP